MEARRARQSRLGSGTRQVFQENSAIPPAVASCLASGRSRLIETPEGEKFVHALVPGIRLIIAGATHLGQHLADLAESVGYNVIVIDPREAFANEERFGKTQILTSGPEISLPALGLDARTAVVALAHAAHIDDYALATVLRFPCFYIGALGSRRTHAKRIERLTAMGFSAADLARIYAPVGLAIGAEGPAEIAVSILAEIIKMGHGFE